MAPRHGQASKSSASSVFLLNPGIMEPTQINKITGRNGSRKERVIAPCYFIDFDDLKGINVIEKLKIIGLKDFLSYSGGIHVGAVKWFYKHVKFEFGVEGGVATIVIKCGETEYTYEPYDFFEHFNLSDDGFENFDVDIWPREEIECENIRALALRMNTYTEIGKEKIVPWAKYLNGDRKFLLRIIRNCILHSTRQDQNMSLLEAVLIELILLKKRINLPYLIVKHMSAALKKVNLGTLPYGTLITRIMRNWKLGNMRVFESLPANIIDRRAIASNIDVVNGALVKMLDIKEESEPMIEEPTAMDDDDDVQIIDPVGPDTLSLFGRFMRTNEQENEIPPMRHGIGSLARALSFNTDERQEFEPTSVNKPAAGHVPSEPRSQERAPTPFAEDKTHMYKYTNPQLPEFLPTPTPANENSEKLPMEQRIKNIEQEVNEMRQSMDHNFLELNRCTNAGILQVFQRIHDWQKQADRRTERMERNWADLVKFWGPLVGCPEKVMAEFREYESDLPPDLDMTGRSYPAL